MKVIEQYNKLANVLKLLPEPKEYQQTFMEIAGYPHYENVCSNILQFYLSPNREHGFGLLMLDSLLAVYGKMVDIDPNSVVVCREVSTKKGNRLDLVIEAGDLFIGIENKIFHAPINDFNDYKTYLKNHVESIEAIGILLTLFEIKESTNLHGFKPITYKQFFDEVLLRLGKSALHANNRYLTYLVDFINSINNLHEGSKMDNATIDFLRKHKSEIKTMLIHTRDFTNELRRKIKSLDESITLDKSKYKHWYWRDDLLDVLVYHIEVSEKIKIQVYAALDPSGWQIQLFNLKGEGRDDLFLLKDWLQNYGVNTEVIRMDNPKWKWQNRLRYGNLIPFTENLSEVKDIFQNLLETITSNARGT